MIDYSKTYACKGCPCINVDVLLAITHGWGEAHSKCNLGVFDSNDETTEPPIECEKKNCVLEALGRLEQGTISGA